MTAEFLRDTSFLRDKSLNFSEIYRLYLLFRVQENFIGEIKFHTVSYRGGFSIDEEAYKIFTYK